MGLATEQGIAAILGIPDKEHATLSDARDAGDRRLKSVIGKATFDLLAAGDSSLATSEWSAAERVEAGARAANLLAVAHHVRTRGQLKMASGGGLVGSVSRGQSFTETFARGDEVAKTAAAFAHEAVRELRHVGLYSIPTSRQNAVIELEAD